jgi:type IV pilus assembly protein PilW
MRIRSRQKGLSLVEVMIAMAIGSVITVGTVQLFVANSETHRLMLGQSRMQESARFSLDFIARSIRQAGYRGCFSNNEALSTTIDPADNLPYEFDLRFGVQGFDSSGVGLWSPALTALPQTTSGGVDTNLYYQLLDGAPAAVLTARNEGAGNGIDIDAVLPGTDVLTLRTMRHEDTEARLDLLLGATDDIVVNDPPGGMNLAIDDMAVIHDCEKATIFRVTSISTSAGLSTIGHDTGDTDDARNSFNTLALKNSFDTDAAVTSIESVTYFVAPGLGQNAQGNTPLSLWRKNGLTAPIELVEGVEDLQILYGVSTDDDNTPNQYVVANAVSDWKDVTTIRITVVVNSVDDTGGTSPPTQTCAVQTCFTGETYDGLMRRAFTQTIKLRNTS